MPIPSEHTNIKFYSRENDEHICTLSISDAHLVVKYVDQEKYPPDYVSKESYRESKEELEKFFRDVLSKWENMKFKMLTGGRTKEGVMWDGMEEIGVDSKFRTNFLFNLFTKEINTNVKRDIFNMKYIVTFDQYPGISIFS